MATVVTPAWKLNDGPRHHIIDNTMERCNLAGVSVNDSTREVFVRSNTMVNNSTHVNANFGGNTIQVERNRFGPAGLTPISVALEGSGGVAVVRNRFDEPCQPADAFLALLGGEIPQFMDNIWCPE